MKHFIFQYISLKNKMRWIRAELRWMRFKRVVREWVSGERPRKNVINELI